MAEDIYNESPPILRRGDGTPIRVVVKIFLSCVAVLGFLWGLYTLRTILLLLLLSLLLSYLFEPIVQAFDGGRIRCGRVSLPLPRLPRFLTIFLVYLFCLAAIIWLSLVFFP